MDPIDWARRGRRFTIKSLGFDDGMDRLELNGMHRCMYESKERSGAIILVVALYFKISGRCV